MSKDPPQDRLSEVVLAHQPAFRLGELEVDPPACVIRQSAIETRLEPRVMQVLVALAQANGATLSRDDLTHACWAGRVVSDDAIQRCVAALRRIGDEVEPSPFRVETIPRVGYRLLRAERNEKADQAPDGAKPAPTAAWTATARWRWARLIVFLALAIAIAVSLVGRQDETRTVDAAGTPAPTLGVVPLVNLTGSPEQEPFVDGLTEELISTLGAVNGVRVPGRASSFQLKGAALTAAQIGDRLAVRYVLEGAVRQEGEQFRVTVQLTDASSGYQIWSGRFDRGSHTVLAMQREIAGAVIEAIPALIGASAPPQLYVDPLAHERYLQGLGLLRSRLFDGGWPEARAAFDAAVAIDPDFAAANALLAICIAELRPAGAEQRAREALAMAISNAPGSAPVLFAQGWIAATFGLGGSEPDLDAARRYYDRVLQLDPTHSEALRARARIEADPARRLSLLEQAAAADPLFYAVHQDLARELASRGQTAAAFQRFENLQRIDPSRGMVGAIELARAGSDLETLGRYAFADIGPALLRRPDRLLVAGLLADFGAIEQARFLYAHPAPDPLLFLPKRREVYLAWLDDDAEAAFAAMADADYSRIEGSSIFGAAVAQLAGHPDDAIKLVLVAYPELPDWTEQRLAELRALPEIIAAHVYAMAVRQRGEAAQARRMLLAMVPAVVRSNAGEPHAQRRHLALAILYAQAGESDQAMDQLRRARAAGWRYPRTYAWINYAPTPAADAPNGYLAPLRELQEFQQMMAEIRVENAAALAEFESRYGVLTRLAAMMTEDSAN